MEKASEEGYGPPVAVELMMMMMMITMTMTTILLTLHNVSC